MNPKAIHASVRIGGLILGACGVALSVLYIKFWWEPPQASDPNGNFFREGPGLLIFLLLEWFLFHAAYLSWFRWSPKAIRHVVSDIFFFITLFSLFYLPFHVPNGWGILIFLAALPTCYITYFLVAHTLILRAFPHSPATPPPLPQQAAIT